MEEKKKVMSKNKIIWMSVGISLSLLIIATVILTTLAMVNKPIKEKNTFNFGEYVLKDNSNISDEITLPEIANGQNVFIDDFILKKDIESKPLYFRVYLKFKGVGAPCLNSQLKTFSNNAYSWKKIGPYFYLVNKEDVPLKVGNTIEYKLLEKDTVKMLEYAKIGNLKYDIKSIVAEKTFNTLEELQIAMNEQEEIKKIHTVKVNIVGEENGTVYYQDYHDTDITYVCVIANEGYEAFVNGDLLSGKYYNFSSVNDVEVNIEFRKKRII